MALSTRSPTRESAQRLVSLVQKIWKTFELPQAQFIDKLVVQAVQVPQLVDIGAPFFCITFALSPVVEESMDQTVRGGGSGAGAVHDGCRPPCCSTEGGPRKSVKGDMLIVVQRLAPMSHTDEEIRARMIALMPGRMSMCNEGARWPRQ